VTSKDGELNMSEPLYVLGRTDKETERLQTQAAFLEPFTERLFRDAGIGRRMKVLDFGSGAGDVALLVARLVGSEGEVISIDTNSAILETARSRARNAGFSRTGLYPGSLCLSPLFPSGSNLEMDLSCLSRIRR
jgi:SAM-dependent methyltransferase